MPSSPTLKRPASFSNFRSSSSSAKSSPRSPQQNNKPFNHAAAARTPGEQKAMRLRVRQLWDTLRSAVHSGTAGWLAKYAAESGAAEKPVSAASINAIELPQFGIGDTLPLPSGTIPFVSVARFLRNHLSLMMASNNNTTSNNSKKSGNNNPPNANHNNNNNSSQSALNNNNDLGGSTKAGDGAGATSANLIRDNFTEERRRTSACKLVLSQHGIGVLTSAFWFMVLRRFRWSIYGESEQQNQNNNNNNIPTKTDPSSGNFGQVMQSYGEFDQSITNHPHNGNNNNNNNLSSSSSLPPPSPFAKSKRPTSALVRSFHTKDQLKPPASSTKKLDNSTTSHRDHSDSNNNNHHENNISPSSSFRKGAALPTMRNADELGESKERIIQYAQGLIFNSAFHFGQIYAKHGTEMRNPAILRIFSQMFSSALLNLLVTEFYDAWTEDEMQAKKRRDVLEQKQQQGRGRTGAGESSSSSSSEDEDEDDNEDDDEYDQDENDEEDYEHNENENDEQRRQKRFRNFKGKKKSGDESNNDNLDGPDDEKEGDAKMKNKNNKKKQKRFKKEKLSNIFNSASSSEEMCLEDHVTELCMSWFYGDQATEALAAAFKPKKESQIAPPVAAASAAANTTTSAVVSRLHQPQQRNASASSNRNNNSTSSPSLVTMMSTSLTPLSPPSAPNNNFQTPPKPLGLMRKNNNSNSSQQQSNFLNNTMSDNNANNNLLQQPLKTSFSPSGHFVPTRHNMELFLRKAKVVDEYVVMQDQANHNNNLNFDVTYNSTSLSDHDNNQQEDQIVLPIKFESRRDFELIAQQRKSLQLQEQYKKNHPVAATTATTTTSGSKTKNDLLNGNEINNSNNVNKSNNNNGSALTSFSDNEAAAMHACNTILTAAALAVGKRATVTDNMEELLHVKDDGTHYSKNSEKDKMTAMLKKRAKFFERNNRHLDYCRSRLTVTGVSVDDLDRDTPFSVTQRSQLLELGEVLANFHMSNMVGAKLNTKSEETMKLMSSFSSSSRNASASPSQQQNNNNNNNNITSSSSLSFLSNATSSAAPMHQQMSMTNAFTPRPEASLQLNYRDTLKQAGLDTSSFSASKPPIRCPFCAGQQPHKLNLDISAMRMGGYAEKQAFRCKCCGQSKAGIVPTMICSRCKSSLCADCVKVSEAPVVENVLSRAAMAAATRSYSALVGQLWGAEISKAQFGPIHPTKSLPPTKATLEDLGVALGTGRNLYTTEQNRQQIVELQHMMGVAAPTTTTVLEKGLLAVPSSMTREQLLIQQRRPLSSVGVVISKSSSRQAMHATACSKISTPTTDIHVVNNTSNNNNHDPNQHHFFRSYSAGQDEDIFRDQKLLSSRPGSAMSSVTTASTISSRVKQRRLPPIPTTTATTTTVKKKHENNNNNNTTTSVTMSTMKTSSDDFANIFYDETAEMRLRQQEQQELLLLQQQQQREENEQKMKLMMEKVGYKYHQGGYSQEFYNTTKNEGGNNDNDQPFSTDVTLEDTNQFFNLTATKFGNDETDENDNNNNNKQQDISATTASASNPNTRTKPPKCAHCTWITNPGLQGRVMRTGCRIDQEVFAATDPVEQHASSIGYGWRNRYLVKMTRVPELDKGNLGRLRSHIQRSLAQARRTVERADAESERERVASVLHGRRLREASSRDMIRQFRQEAEAQSTRLSGGAIDEGYHKRQIANAIEKYANKFCAGATSTAMLMMSVPNGNHHQKKEEGHDGDNSDSEEHEEDDDFDEQQDHNNIFSDNGGDLGATRKLSTASSDKRRRDIIPVSQSAIDRIALAHKMLDDIGSHSSLGQLGAKARRKVVDFIVHEKASIAKAQSAAGRLKELLAWSRRQGDELSVEELVADLDIDPEEIGLAMNNNNASGNLDFNSRSDARKNSTTATSSTPQPRQQQQQQRRASSISSSLAPFTSLTPPPTFNSNNDNDTTLPNLVHDYHSPTLPKANLNPFTNFKAFGNIPDDPDGDANNNNNSSSSRLQSTTEHPLGFSVEKAKEHSRRRRSSIIASELAAAAAKEEAAKAQIVRESISAVKRSVSNNNNNHQHPTTVSFVEEGQRRQSTSNKNSNDDDDDEHQQEEIDDDDVDSEADLENRQAEDQELAIKTAKFSVRRRTIAETVEKRMQEFMMMQSAADDDDHRDQNVNNDHNRNKKLDQFVLSKRRKSSSSITADEIVERTLEEMKEDAKAEKLLKSL